MNPAIRPIYLVGPPGSGKSSLGAAACRQLGLTFAETPEAGPLAVAAVVTLPWSRMGDSSLRREARKAGILLGLWAHPLQLAQRSSRPYWCVPSRPMTTDQGYGRTGDGTREHRQLVRHCHTVLDFRKVAEAQAVVELAEVLVDLRTPRDPLEQRLSDVRDWAMDCAADNGVSSRTVEIAARAVAEWLLEVEAAGASPRKLSGLESDLQAALMLVCMFDRPTPATVLRCFGTPPHTYEFGRKFSGTDAALRRYEAQLGAFGEWLLRRGG